MKIKTKVNNKKIEVEVSRPTCAQYECFSPSKFNHYGKSIDGSQSSWQDKFYSCLHRNYHGCPDEPKIMEE